ncbi:hypothetical protein TNCV_4885871 [Trichonephila clavipes]|uniref:Uncharacterized protein n=1 Tax=Trichonephila clavipes TaxID=2585209 RepID=A0A8X6RQE6_TRICX|nr:hypothetical protein TNCV_4885871 [Trichonephila clavipes]
MENLSDQSFIPTNLGRVDEEMIPPGHEVSQRDHWTLKVHVQMSRSGGQVKLDPQCLSPQASLVLIYRPTAGGMMG